MYKKEQTFRTKVYSMYLYSVLILSTIVLLVFWGYSMYEFHEREERNIENVLNSVSQNLELQFAEVKEVRDAFYFNDVFKKAEQLNNPKLYEFYDEIQLIELEDGYSMTLQKIMHTSSQKIRTIAFFPISGGDTMYYLGMRNADIQKIEYHNYQLEEWYLEAVENPYDVVFYEPHIPCYMENSRLGEVYSYICGVTNLDTHKLIGVVKIDVDAENMRDTLQMFSQTEGNQIVLLKNGEIFTQSQKLEKDLNSYLIVEKDIPGTQLKVAYLNTFSRQYGGYINLSLGALAIILLAVLLAFMNYQKQAKKIVDDMNQLMAGIQEVETGRLDYQIEIDSDSEYQKIARTINHMTRRLKEYIEREYILVIQQQKAQYLALQSQINPHFLYNTLNGFIALNRMGEKEVLEKSIIELSSMFRYTCSTKDIVTVEEELAFLQDYLKLEKLKYEERLNYVFDVDETCRYRKIPKLLFQPIVENSIKYGRGNTDRSIEIRISAKAETIKGIGNVMVLSFSDNGVGFDVDAKEREESVGLKNIRIRTELYCKNAIYQCTSKPGIGTRTILIFPDEGGENNDSADSR